MSLAKFSKHRVPTSYTMKHFWFIKYFIPYTPILCVSASLRETKNDS